MAADLRSDSSIVPVDEAKRSEPSSELAAQHCVHPVLELLARHGIVTDDLSEGATNRR